MATEKYTDPGLLRTNLQARYDDYMARRRLLIGVRIPGIDVTSMGSSPEERTSAYEALADRYPRRTAKLVCAVAKEVIFEQGCAIDHWTVVKNFEANLYEEEWSKGSRLLIASGLGRNAIIFTLTASRDTDVLPYGELPDNLMDISDALVINGDYGMGDVRIPSLELAGVVAKVNA